MFLSLKSSLLFRAMAENAEESVFSAEVVGSAPNKESGAHVPSTIDANGSEARDGQLAAAASRGSEEGDGQPRRLESAASRGSVHSSLSRISMSPCQRTTPYGASRLMAYKVSRWTFLNLLPLSLILTKFYVFNRLPFSPFVCASICCMLFAQPI